MGLPTPVQATVDAYRRALHDEAPGLVEGLYLVGSVALDDFQPHTSDIDFVAVTASRLQPRQVEALGRVHAALRARQRRPFFDGVYVTWDDLATDPAQLDPGPSVHEGRLKAQDRGERNPITWHTLAQQGVACCGPSPAALAIWQNRERLAAWTNDNLDAYWRRLLDRSQRIGSLYGLMGLSAWACAWCVLGVTRLHYTLASGQITSKCGAGLYALETFPKRWHRVVEEALRIRRGAGGRSLYRFPWARRSEVFSFTAWVIEDAHRLYAESV